MSIFRRKKCNISEPDPTYKVRYLGNVQTTMMKGEGCVDKPASVLWNNHIRTGSAGLTMKLTISSSGLKAVTKEQGITEYSAHRVSYCIAHPTYPKVFLWVYRHEGRKLKVELRCHAVLCRSESQAKAMAVQLHDKLALSLAEFVRDKTRKQNGRIVFEKLNNMSMDGTAMDAPGEPMRRKMLTTGSNFKPPVERSTSAPKLGSISEGQEPDFIEADEEEEEEEEDRVLASIRVRRIHKDSSFEEDDAYSNSPNSLDNMDVFQFEIGNDIKQLKADNGVQTHLTEGSLSDEDDDGSESGFSEQDSPESSSTSSQSSQGSDSVGGDEMEMDFSRRTMSVTSAEFQMTFCAIPSPRGARKSLSPGSTDSPASSPDSNHSASSNEEFAQITRNLDNLVLSAAQ